MTGPFAFFPFDMPYGAAFVVVYGLMLVGIPVLAVWARHGVARRLDRPPVRTLPSPPPNLGGYRTEAAADAELLLVPGVFPRGEQVWLVAWLRAGKAGVEQALLANAVATGWLVAVGDGTFTVFPHPPPDRLLAAFHAALLAGGSTSVPAATVCQTARSVVRAWVPVLQAAARSAGMVSHTERKAILVLTMVLPGLLMMAIPIIRFSVQGPMFELHAYLLVAMMIVGLVVLVLGTQVPPSTVAKPYLDWLGDATTSLVADVSTGRRVDPIAVTLAAALAGIGVLSLAPAT